MSRTRQDRINDALAQLVDRALPPVTITSPTDSAANDHFNRILERVRDVVEIAESQPAVVQDVNHIADLVKQRLLSKSEDTEQALKFGNLYARLLAQPVLEQKWGILYFLYLLGDVKDRRSVVEGSLNGRVAHDRVIALSSRSRIGGDSTLPEARMVDGIDSHRAERDSRVFEDAFARGGLPDLVMRQQQQQQRRESDRERTNRPPSSARRRPQPNGEPQDIEHRSNGTSANSSHISEAALLRDIPFMLQGVSTTNLTFTSPTILKMPPTLPVPVLSLLNTLAEPGLLYKHISAYLDTSDGGLVAQSLRAAIGDECRSYLGLVATLETQVRKAVALVETVEIPTEKRRGRNGLGKAGVTLKRCVIWTRDATLGLRLMSLIVDESKTRRGGQLISLIHSLATTHGDPFVSNFAERLLSHVTKPFYDMLRSWIYDGELSDPFLEFFVTEGQTDEDEASGGARYGLTFNNTTHSGATSVWDAKYHFNAAMVPSIISTDFAQKVFLIGKSLNFIRHACNDAAWVESYSKTSSQQANQLTYALTTTSLTASISKAHQTVMAHLMSLLYTKFHLLTHLQALKHYLLLTRGDFIALLTTSLSPYLSLPANSQYRHTLTAQLEHAVRGSNAQHDPPEVLRRLDARMLELSHGEIGWDVFTLEYRVEAPLDVIVTPASNRQYLKVFNFLWRIKRVEYALASSWSRATTGARGVLSAVDDVMGKDWRVARGVVAEMAHFVGQLQNYILFEVIETSWAVLQKELTREDRTLDDVIRAHEVYLQSITRKGLLGSSASASTSGGGGGRAVSASPATSTDFTPQLHELLKLMLAYKDAVDTLYALSVSEFTQRQARETRIERRTEKGGWGVTERDGDGNDDDDEDMDEASPLAAASAKRGKSKSKSSSRFRGPATEPESPAASLLFSSASAAGTNINSTLPTIRHRMKDLATSFRARVCVLLGDLAAQPDTELRFLGVVMNFNDVYRVVRSKSTTGTRSSAKDAGAQSAAGKVGDRRRVEKQKEKEKGRGKDEGETRGAVASSTRGGENDSEAPGVGDGAAGAAAIAR